jgi:hypothetical protein
MPWWNIFNIFGKYVGEVEADDKEIAQRFTRELRYGDDVDLLRDTKWTKKEQDYNITEDN